MRRDELLRRSEGVRPARDSTYSFREPSLQPHLAPRHGIGTSNVCGDNPRPHVPLERLLAEQVLRREPVSLGLPTECVGKIERERALSLRRESSPPRPSPLLTPRPPGLSQFALEGG